MKIINLFLLLCSIISAHQSIHAQSAGIPVSEYNSLTEFYEVSFGPGWTNSSNWLDTTNHSVSDWYGVTVENGHVTKIELPSNNVQEAILLHKLDLTELQVLDLSNNNIMELEKELHDNLSRLNTLKIENNRLDFNDILTAMSLDRYNSFSDNFTYSPQKQFEWLSEDIVIRTGNSFTLSVRSFNISPNDQFQWFFEDNLLNGENNSTLQVANANASHSGIYHLEITNPEVPGLAIKSADRIVEVKDIITEIPISEYEALQDFYEALDGDNWNNNMNWLDTMPVNDWHGVTVSSGHVTSFQLSQNNLVGAIPKSIANLKYLKYLYLGGNSITSISPETGNLVNLEYLNLRGNNISSIPPDLGNLEKLYSLNLDNNQIQSVPPELGNLTNLNLLELDYNLIESIPSDIKNLKNIRVIALSNNNLKIPIPDWIGNLTNLEWLDISHNELYSSIPESFINLKKLVYLFLANNKIEGKIPAYLGQCSNLKDINLSNNNIIGGIPSELGNLSKLETLFLSKNSIEGNLPKEIGNLKNLQSLDLDFNQLTGTIPQEIGNLSLLRYLSLRFNALHGPLPAEMGNLKNLEYLHLSSNWIGKISEESIPRVERQIPDELSQLTGLTHLEIDRNRTQFNDIEPIFSWPAYENFIQFKYQQSQGEHDDTIIYAQPEDTVKINILYYYASKSDKYQWLKNGEAIEGENDSTLILTKVQPEDEGVYNCEISNSVATKSSIILSATELKVQGKARAGVPVSEYRALEDFYNSTNGANWTNNDNWLDTINCTVEDWWGIELMDGHVWSIQLDTNNVSGPIPESIENLYYLAKLNLYDNALTGEIPQTISNLVYLNSLILSKNKLSGTIPAFIGSLNQLVHLWLDYNNFEGLIPYSIGNLSYLRYLYLSNNNLSGTIPTSFGNLVQLRQLILSNNRLTGPLPVELENLKNLYRFEIENNLIGNTNQSTTTKSAKLQNNRQIPDELATLLEMDTLYLGGNNLQFNDIEAIFSWSNFNNLEDFIYYPQDSIGVDTIIERIKGNDISLAIPDYYPGLSDTYQWYKNDTIIEGTNNAVLNLNEIQSSDTGIYFCKVTNQVATELALYSRPIVVSVLTTDIANFRINKDINIYPNPADEQIYIDTQNKILNLKIFNLAGTLVFENQEINSGWLSVEQFARGVYIFRIQEKESGIINKKVIIE